MPPGLDPGIHAMSNNPTCDKDCRVEPGNDDLIERSAFI
jgi:hypothetical protein